MIKENSTKNSKKPEILQKIADLRSFVAARRAEGRRIALVPTMGALHDGHMELVRQGHRHADIVITTIFVNPTQFGPNEDFSAYPRTWEADLALLAGEGAAAVFYPAVTEIYPSGFATTISVDHVTHPLEGAHRPGHFDGVATIVAKLLLQALPDVALFGEKDWQQLQVIRRLTTDLDIPVTIIGVPTKRDEEGLALSSRNAYLDDAQYRIAIRLNKIMAEMASRVRNGDPINAVEKWAAAETLAAGFDSIDYLCIRETAYLAEPDTHTPFDAMRVLAAVRLGKARLIDNCPV